MMARTTSTGPAHVARSGRAICCGAHATLPVPDGTPMCRQCAAIIARRTRS